MKQGQRQRALRALGWSIGGNAKDARARAGQVRAFDRRQAFRHEAKAGEITPEEQRAYAPCSDPDCEVCA